MHLYVYPSPFETSRTYYVIADDDGGDSIFLLSSIVVGTGKVNGKSEDIDDAKETWQKWLVDNGGNSAYNKFQCEVVGFELPQEISDAEEYITFFGDPEYLIYYEKFPAEEKESWQFQQETWFMVGLGVRAAFVAIPLVKHIPGVGSISKFLKVDKISRIQRLTRTLDKLDDVAKSKRIAKILKIASEVGDDGIAAFLKAASSSTKNFVTGSVADDIAVNAIKKIAIYRAQGGTLASSNRIKAISNTLKKQFDYYGMDGAKYAADFKKLAEQGKNLEGALSTVMGSSLDDITKLVLSSNYIQIMKQVGFSNFAKVAFSKNGIKTTEKLMRKSFPHLKKLQSVHPEVYKQVMSNMDDAARTLFSKGTPKILMESSEVLVQNSDDVIKLMAEGGDDAIGAILANVLKTKESASVVKTAIQSGGQWAKASSKELWKCAALAPAIMAGGALEFMTNGAIPTPIGTITSGAVINLGTAGIVAGPITASAGCINFLRYNYIPLLIASGYLFERAESQSQMFVPVGTDNIGVVKPKYEIPQAIPKTYALENTKNLYMIMRKDQTQAPKRFFLASPCKTDLKITQDYCTCQIADSEFMYEFEHKGQRLQTIEPIGLPITTQYSWDSMTQDEKNDFITGRYHYPDEYWQRDITFAFYFKQIFARYEEDDFVDQRKEFFKFFFQDKRTFAMIFASRYDSNIENYIARVPLTKLISKISKVLELSDEEYLTFLDTLAEEYFIDNPINIETLSLSTTDKTYINKIIRILFLDTAVVPGYELTLEKEFDYLLKWNKENYDEYWTKTDDEYWDDYKINWIKLGTTELIRLQALQEVDSGISTIGKRVKDMQMLRLLNSKYLDEFARQSALKTYIVDTSAPDSDKMVKTCSGIGISEKTPPTKTNKGQNINLKTTVPCIAVETQKIDHYANTEEWNGGNNYCFSGTSPTITTMGNFLEGLSIAVGVGGILASPFTAGTSTAAGITLAYTGVELSAMITSYIINVCSEWPKHSTGLSGCRWLPI